MSREMETKEAKLRIERLDSSRSGRSLCYIDQAVLDNMRLSTGDIVEIIGRKRTAITEMSSINMRNLFRFIRGNPWTSLTLVYDICGKN